MFHKTTRLLRSFTDLLTSRGMPMLSPFFGVLYNTGLGVPKDYKAAVKW